MKNKIGLLAVLYLFMEKRHCTPPTDEELKDRIRAALAEKPDGHHFREKAKEDDTESLCMSQIGG